MTHKRFTPAVVAVDGGGTKCVLVLDGPAGRVEVTRGPANVTTDFEAAVAEIRAGLLELAGKAGMPPDDLRALPTYLGLAGASDRAISARVEAALALPRVRVEEDRHCALQGALGDSDGAIAHCGTGSFFGVRQAGAARFVGGWGWKLGDEASAFWVGREALTATLEVVDGLRPPGALSTNLLGRWSCPAGIVAFAGEATPGRIGELAPEIADAAAEGDALGLDVMRRGAAHIADMLTRLGWQPGLAICFTGRFAPTYTPYLPEAMRAALRPAAATPIDGAAALARAFAAETGP